MSLPSSQGGAESPGDEHEVLAACLKRLAAGDPSARDQLIATASERMEKQARRMLKTFPNVHRWEQTGDVVNNAVMRFMRSLDQVAITDGKAFLCLCAVHVRRELLDLARKFSGPQSFAKNQGTNYQRHPDGLRAKIDEAVSPDESHEELDRWAAMHEAADQLPREQRDVFDLVFYNAKTRVEAAAILSVSEKTVQRRMKEAVAAIDKAVKRL